MLKRIIKRALRRPRYLAGIIRNELEQMPFRRWLHSRAVRWAR